MAWISFPIAKGVRMGIPLGGRRGGDGVGALLFAMLMLFVAVIAFYVALAAATVHTFAKAIVNLAEGKFVVAALWLCLGVVLVNWEYEADIWTLRECASRPAPVADQASQECRGWTWNPKDNEWEWLSHADE
jgi:hypothetical protein